MKVGVLSDTHLSRGDNPERLQEIINTHMKDCKVIVHGGDLVSMVPFYHIIPDEVEFIPVSGNMDQVGETSELPAKRIVEIEGKRIGLMHGYGAGSELKQLLVKEWAKEDVDAIVFGHSHQPCNEIIGGRLLFNPGSPIDKRSTQYASVGILEIEREITGRIIKLED